jgi:hypothetical protein
MSTFVYNFGSNKIKAIRGVLRISAAGSENRGSLGQRAVSVC